MEKPIGKLKANKIAKLYIKGLFVYCDSFFSENLSKLENELVQEQVLLIVDRVCPDNEIPPNVENIVSLIKDNKK